jgi:hypothetical protein
VSNIPLDDDEFGGNGGGPLPPFWPAGGPRLQLPPWQPPQSWYPPLPPSLPNHPSPSPARLRSGSVLSYQNLPSLIQSCAPMPASFNPYSDAEFLDNDQIACLLEE